MTLTPQAGQLLLAPTGHGNRRRQINSFQRIMWAGALTGGTAHLIDAQITFGGFDNWQTRFAVDNRYAS